MNTIEKLFCAAFGHCRIYKVSLGYVHCARCNELIGDELGGVFDYDGGVLVDHNCATCFENYELMPWYQKALVPYPFRHDDKGEYRIINDEERKKEREEIMAKLREENRQRQLRSQEMETLWNDIDPEILSWVQDMKEEDVLKLLREAYYQNLPVTQFFKEKFQKRQNINF